MHAKACEESESPSFGRNPAAGSRRERADQVILERYRAKRKSGPGPVGGCSRSGRVAHKPGSECEGPPSRSVSFLRENPSCKLTGKAILFPAGADGTAAHT